MQSEYIYETKSLAKFSWYNKGVFTLNEFSK